MDYFRNTDEKESLRDIRADQIAVVGDRLLTDMCLANEMGSWGVWVKDGVVDMKSKSVVSLISSRSRGTRDILLQFGKVWSTTGENLLTSDAPSLQGWSKGLARS